MSSYHSMRSSGLWPPCMRMRVPPQASSSSTFSPNSRRLLMHVDFGMAGHTVEGAELAVGGAGVGVVDVAIHEIGDDARLGAQQAQLVGDFHQGAGIGFGVKVQPLFGGEAFTSGCFFEKVGCVHKKIGIGYWVLGIGYWVLSETREYPISKYPVSTMLCFALARCLLSRPC